MALQRRCYYVAAFPPGGQPVLLLGPYPTPQQAHDDIVPARTAYRRRRPGSYGYTYEVAWTSPEGDPPEGILNQALGRGHLLGTALEEVPWPSSGGGRWVSPAEHRRTLPPYVNAEFTLASAPGTRCRVMRLTPGRVWWREVLPDGTWGPSHNVTWEEFAADLGTWVQHKLL